MLNVLPSPNHSLCRIPSANQKASRLCPNGLLILSKQAEPIGPLGHIGSVVRVQFFHQVEPMGLYGFEAYTQDLGNVSITRAFGDQLQDLAFSPGQADTAGRVPSAA
jgi:hypothetical protein